MTWEIHVQIHGISCRYFPAQSLTLGRRVVAGDVRRPEDSILQGNCAEDEDAEGASSDADWDALLHINDMWVSENGLDPTNNLNEWGNDKKGLRTLYLERRSHVVLCLRYVTGAFYKQENSF